MYIGEMFRQKKHWVDRAHEALSEVRPKHDPYGENVPKKIEDVFYEVGGYDNDRTHLLLQEFVADYYKYMDQVEELNKQMVRKTLDVLKDLAKN